MNLCIDLTSFFSWTGWVGVAAIGTVVAACIAARYTYLTRGLLQSTAGSIEGQRKLAEFQIYIKLSEKLEGDIAQELIEACIDKTLVIDDNIGKDIEKFGGKVTVKGFYLDKHLLNPIEDMAKFYEDGLIGLDSINFGFGYSILIAGNNHEVRAHLVLVRSKFVDAFKGFQGMYKDLHGKCSAVEKMQYKSTLFD